MINVYLKSNYDWHKKLKRYKSSTHRKNTQTTCMRFSPRRIRPIGRLKQDNQNKNFIKIVITGNKTQRNPAE